MSMSMSRSGALPLSMLPLWEQVQCHRKRCTPSPCWPASVWWSEEDEKEKQGEKALYPQPMLAGWCVRHHYGKGGRRERWG